jgi:ribosome biogenesis protein MAK21
MLTIIETGSKAWAVAATDEDLRIYSREQAGAWSELPLGEESERIDEDGNVILEALYERQTGQPQDNDAEEPEAEADEPEEEEQEPEAEDEEPEEEEEEPEAEQEEEPEEAKPRRSRGRTKAKK